MRQFLADAGERRLQVQVDVVGERLQRRDVQHLRGIGEPVGQAFAHQCVDGGEEGGQRLARAGRRGDQHVLAGRDRWPCLGLRGGGRGKAPREPASHRRVEGRKDRVDRHGAIIHPSAGAGLNAGRRGEIEAELGGHRASVRAVRLAG